MNRRRLVAASAALPALAAPRLASAQAQVRWRMAASFPKSLDTLFGAPEHISRRVAQITDNAFQIRVFAPGELVPALQVLDAVQANTIEAGYTSAYYYLGKDPSFVFPTCVPFGLNARQQYAWTLYGGGREMIAEIYGDYGVQAFPAGNTGAQMGGWFRKEIRTVEDIKGLKFRIAGMAGNVLAKLGAVPQQLGGPDIYPALERGVIDGAEWVGPYDDEKLGFHRVAPYYYYPGWWEGGPQIDAIVNKQAWTALPDAYKAAFEAACAEAMAAQTARYDAQNPPAMKRLLADKVQLRPFPRDVLIASYKAAREYYVEVGEKNARFKRFFESWDRFRDDTQTWFRVAEGGFDNFMAYVSAQRM